MSAQLLIARFMMRVKLKPYYRSYVLRYILYSVQFMYSSRMNGELDYLRVSERHGETSTVAESGRAAEGPRPPRVAADMMRRYRAVISSRAALFCYVTIVLASLCVCESVPL